MGLCAEGLTSEGIARELHISLETVKAYRKRIILKMQAKNMTHAVVEAIRKGWL